MKGKRDAQHDAIMARLRQEGRLGQHGQVRLVSLTQAHDEADKRKIRKSATPARQRAPIKTPAPPPKVSVDESHQTWSMAGLYQFFDAAGFSREEAELQLADYQKGHIYDQRKLGPFVLHEPFVRAALKRGENVPRSILELHPSLLPESDILHGIRKNSREEKLLKEARMLHWIGYNASRESFHPDGRWWIGAPERARGMDSAVGRTAMDALKEVWKNVPTQLGSAPEMDEGGPWTLAEQRERLNQEKARLTKLYAKLKIKAPRVPSYDEVVLWARNSVLARASDLEAGFSEGARTVRGNLRDANKYGLRRQHELDQARLWKALPEGHPDRPRRFDGDPNTGWINENLRDALQRIGYSKPEVIKEALADQSFMAKLEPYVVTRLDKFLNERRPNP